jgi:pantothenate kinase
MTQQHPINTLDALADHVLQQRGIRDGKRQMVGVVGAPGAGKSTLSEALCAQINAANTGSCAVVPMDGFHFDDAILKARDLLPRKGAPNTFDVDGFAHLHQRLVAEDGRDIAVPVFDRSMELSRASARIIQPSVRTVLVEGNYVLLDEPHWQDLRAFYDLTIMIDVPFEKLEARLRARWEHFGLTGDALRTKLQGNDLPNVRLVLNHSAAADIIYTGSSD